MYRELVSNAFISVLSKNHFEQALSACTARLCSCLTALQPDWSVWSLLVQEHPRGRPHHHSERRCESGQSHSLHAPLLCNLRHDTDERWQHRMFSCLFMRGDVVRVGRELDSQIAHIHGNSIPLQPEARTLLPHTIFRKGNRLYLCSFTR
jgi:hypothetical protein